MLFSPPNSVTVTTKDERLGLLQTTHSVRVIVAFNGPWRLSGSWWSTPFDRLYFEAETDDRNRYLLFYDQLASRWFLQGIFD
jgi:hypothetical protein